jgi:hypothetical protein
MDAERRATVWKRLGRWLGVRLGVYLVGCVFIAWQNRFHYSAPLVFVCLAYLAVVLTVFNLWRTGTAVVRSDLYGDDAWTRPLGARDELDKEKRTLLKAIKEAEFDRDMGKLSAHDADQMIRPYRARAIEVIKAIEGLDAQSASVREQIAREVKARVEMADKDAKGKKKKGKRAEAPS